MNMKCRLLAVAVSGGIFTVVHPAFAQTWTQTSAPVTNLQWQSIAASADGTHLVATTSTGSQPLSGPIYTSADSGKTWMSNAISVQNWVGTASSADGTQLLALVPQSSRIAASTNSGASWTFSIAPAQLGCVASSADGAKVVSGVRFNGSIYSSTNSGTNWTPAPNTSGISWRSIASSADGMKCVAVGEIAGRPVGVIYTSTDSGNTWISNNAPNLLWVSVASSADGNILVAAPGGFNFSKGPLAISTNSGLSWFTNTSPVLAWTAAASSADGSKLVATALAADGNNTFANSIFTSTDLDATWIPNTVPAQNWSSVVSSADGNVLLAGTIYGGIWISQSAISPRLNASSLGNNLILSWTIPSTGFALQQSFDLISWATVSDPPALNFVNLQYQFTVPLTNSAGFFRLASP